VSVGSLFRTIVVIAFSALPLGLTVWALLDCTRRPAWAWGLSGHDRVPWLTAILLGILCVPVGMGISAWYLVRVRPDVGAAEEGRLR
jgi:hypothetical protein